MADGYEIVSRCTALHNPADPDSRCNGTYLSNGEVACGCDKPCSFAMCKPGEGDPPFLHPDDLIIEIRRLMLRQSRTPLVES